MPGSNRCQQLIGTNIWWCRGPVKLIGHVQDLYGSTTEVHKEMMVDSGEFVSLEEVLSAVTSSLDVLAKHSMQMVDAEGMYQALHSSLSLMNTLESIPWDQTEVELKGNTTRQIIADISLVSRELFRQLKIVESFTIATKRPLFTVWHHIVLSQQLLLLGGRRLCSGITPKLCGDLYLNGPEV